ncbi:MAG: hypothetical protein GY926_25850, partial [bacterium]|nr:hypothetical protein [bacterium]
MKRSIVALGVLIAALAVPLTPAAGSVPQEDNCTVAPTLLTTVEHATESRQRTPRFVADHVWFGGSVYLPDGTMIGPVRDVSPRGEAPQFTDHVLNAQQATWGVVVTRHPGAAIYSPVGDLLFELPIEVHAEAMYEGEHILVADWGEVGGHLERVLLVKQDGSIVELTDVANGFNQFGTIVDNTVYVLLRDGGIATFDLAGQAGPILEPATIFSGITAANGYIYAYEGPVYGHGVFDTIVHVFADEGVNVTEVTLDGSAVRLGPTALGFAADVFSDDGNAAIAMAPNGAGVTELAGLHDTTDPRDSLAWHRGRYLVGLDVVSETADELVATARVMLYRLDGTPINTSASFEYRIWPTSWLAGTVLAMIGSDGRTVNFRSLAGDLLSHADFGLASPHEIETVDGNDQHIWITTQQ